MTEQESGDTKERRARFNEPSIEDLFDAYLERMKGHIPPDFVTHIRNARKEWYMALRSILDAKIQSMDEAEQRAAARRTIKVKID